MHSVVGQGKVEAILASSPFERRALVEEAAGLGRFKRRRHRAELKLARVAREVERARDVEAEARKRLRPLALQATAAERAEKLGRQIAGIEARIAELDLAFARRASGAGRGTEGSLGARAKARGEPARVASARAREGRGRARRRRRAARGGDRGALSPAERRRARGAADGKPRRLRPTGSSESSKRRARPVLSHDVEETLAAARDAARERDRLTAQAAAAIDRLHALERSLAEREGIPSAAPRAVRAWARARAGRARGRAGYERAVAAALAFRASAVTATTPSEALGLVEDARARGLGRLFVLVPATAAAGSAARSPTPKAEPLADHVTRPERARTTPGSSTATSCSRRGAASS